MRRPLSFSARAVAIALALGVLALVGIRALGGSPYELKVLMPSADNTFLGGQVLVDGNAVGEITDIGVRDGQAELTLAIDEEHAPLPAGTRARVKWQSVIGARVVELVPGGDDNIALPSGHLITDNVEGVEIDDLLAMLDAPTRAKLQGLLGELDQTLEGNEQQVNDTLRDAGPTFRALGEVLRAVGEDGPAIKQLVTQLAGVTGTVAARDDKITQSIGDLAELTQAVAGQQEALGALLERLPGTIATATETLEGVPGPVSSARTILRDLRPATARLPGIAADLRPVLASARPALDDLTPALREADTLLQETPDLVTALDDALPRTESALIKVNPMVDYLRPYTPELAGWLSNWVGIFGSQNAKGNYARALITESSTSLSSLPTLPPGNSIDQRPQPGSLAGQAWTDANGDEIQ